MDDYTDTEMNTDLEQLASNGELRLDINSRHVTGRLYTRGAIIRSMSDRTSEDMLVQVARIVHDLRQQLIYTFG